MFSDEILTEENVVLYAMKAYDNPSCQNIEEFREDLNRTKYIKRLLNRYVKSGALKERLILNHLMVFYNVFGIDAATKILFFRLDESLYPSLKTFLVFLNYMPEIVYNGEGKMVYGSDIPLEEPIAETLRSIIR